MQQKATNRSVDDDWLNDTEEQMQAEDALWDATVARQAEKFAALRKAAYVEIKAGATQPMFDERGKLIVDELAPSNKTG